MSDKLVHVLSDGFQAPNARALVYPLLIHQDALEANGIKIRIFNQPISSFGDCDLVFIDSKHFRGKVQGTLDYIHEKLEYFSSKCNCVSWYDSTDSAGWLVGSVLPYVQRYFKNQILRDRAAYLKPMYGRRTYTDFYHHTKGITDRIADDAPQVTDPLLLKRLRLGWNSGLADYSRFGPTRMALYEKLRWRALLTYPRIVEAACAPRPISLSCRMGTSYNRNSVAYQRKKIQELLTNRIAMRKLRRSKYFAELKKSRAVISPFGLGEITLKDFEVFLTGGLLVKPDMSHLETWPDLFVRDKTMAGFNWDLTDFESMIEEALNNTSKTEHIAAEGQKKYIRYASSTEASELFVSHFSGLVSEATKDND